MFRLCLLCNVASKTRCCGKIIYCINTSYSSLLYILKLLFPTDYVILDRVTGKDVRRHPAGLCLLQLCVWIKLKHSSLLFPSCPETSFTEHAALSFFNSFLYSFNSTFLCRLPFSQHILSLSCHLSLSPSHSSPLRLTESCGASAAGSLPVGYITAPSGSLNHCWAKGSWFSATKLANVCKKTQPC